jgi:hypothetical protein
LNHVMQDEDVFTIIKRKGIWFWLNKDHRSIKQNKSKLKR